MLPLTRDSAMDHSQFLVIVEDGATVSRSLFIAGA